MDHNSGRYKIMDYKYLEKSSGAQIPKEWLLVKKTRQGIFSENGALIFGEGNADLQKITFGDSRFRSTETVRQAMRLRFSRKFFDSLCFDGVVFQRRIVLHQRTNTNVWFHGTSLLDARLYFSCRQDSNFETGRNDHDEILDQ